MGSSRKGRRTPELLDAARRKALRAVVLDTNVYGEGRPNLRSLKTLAERLGRSGIEVWVHELVAAEWAEHLADDVERYMRTASSARRALDRALMDAGDYSLPYRNTVAVVDAFLDALAKIPNVVTVPLSKKAAADGLRDQVLQRGPGTRKSGIKTGASDSAWVRDVIAKAKHKVDAILIVTNDRADVTKTCRSLDIDPPDMAPLPHIAPMLFTLIPDTGYLTTMLARHLVQKLQPRSEPRGWAYHGDVQLLPFDLGPIDFAQALSIDDPWGSEITGADVVRVNDIVAITDVAVEQSGDRDDADDQPTSAAERVSARIWLLVDIEAATFHIDGDGALIEGTASFPDVLVVVDVLADAVDNAIRDVEVTGAARVEVAGRYGDSFEAMEAVRDMLLTAGVDVPDTWLDQPDDFDTTVADAVPVEVSLTGDTTHEFEVTIVAGAHEGSIDCSYDDSTWVGGSREGMYMEPPYQLLSNRDRWRTADDGWRALGVVVVAIADAEPPV